MLIFVAEVLRWNKWDINIWTILNKQLSIILSKYVHMMKDVQTKH